MQMTSLSNPYSQSTSSLPRVKRKLIKEELDLRDRKESDISPWWKIVTVLSYFLVVAGGISTSISVGTLLDVFANRCPFYARIIVKGLDDLRAKGSFQLDDENIVSQEYGRLEDCQFAQYWSVASTIFGGVWGILFLQCGKGGTNQRRDYSSSDAWVIVPPALLVDIAFFIIACVIFGTTFGGLGYFCSHLIAEDMDGSVTNATCHDIMRFTFPEDLYDSDVYLNYVMAQFGSALTFAGWLVALFVLIIRCFIPVDFVVYGRRLYENEVNESNPQRHTSAENRRAKFASSRSTAIDEELSSKSSSVEVISETVVEKPNVATTSFSISVATTSHPKKTS